MTIVDVRGHGTQRGHKEVYRGQEYEVDLPPKVLVTVFVRDEMVASVRRAIVEAARTGKIGDGKIIESDIVQATRIRTCESGDAALSRSKRLVTREIQLAGGRHANRLA